MEVPTHNLSAGEVDTGGSPTLAEKSAAESMRDIVSKNKVESD